MKYKTQSEIRFPMQLSSTIINALYISHRIRLFVAVCFNEKDSESQQTTDQKDPEIQLEEKNQH